jgi:hypothetical protein
MALWNYGQEEKAAISSGGITHTHIYTYLTYFTEIHHNETVKESRMSSALILFLSFLCFFLALETTSPKIYHVFLQSPNPDADKRSKL